MLACRYLSYRTEDRVPLNALLWEPASPCHTVMILVPGFYGSFHQGHDYQPLAQGLAEQGIALMAINLRTANDFTDPRIDDVLPDIAAAIDAAHAQGLVRVALFGTSVGGPRAAHFMARRGHPSIQAFGLIAAIVSPYGEAQYRLDATERIRLEAFLADCRKAIAEGRGHEPVRYENWFPGRAVTMTARGFVQMFGNAQDTPLAAVGWDQVKVPTLLLHGTRDVVSLPPNATDIHAALGNAPRRDLVWVEGAGHVLSPGESARAYADHIVRWLAEVLG
jgi:pimeloyl-ACP methyl ester carboxylesterase